MAVEARTMLIPAIVIALFPSIAQAEPGWGSSVVYGAILMLPILISYSLAPVFYKKKIVIIGIPLVSMCTLIIGMDIGIVIFYIVTSLPLLLIYLAVYLRRSHLDKKLHIEDIQ